MTNAPMEREISFETRAVAFIDILGWQTAVEMSVSNVRLRQKIHNAVSALGAMALKDAQDDKPELPSFDRTSQFSDSVIISIPFSQPHDLTRLIRQIAGYQQSMVLSGFLLRGGITVGQMFHEGTIAFGPALNAAYQLEKVHASFPRVAIDASLAGATGMATKQFPSRWPFVRRDTDGYFFPDYLTILARSPSATKQIEAFIATRLVEFSDQPRTHSKYEWLDSKWREAKGV